MISTMHHAERAERLAAAEVQRGVPERAPELDLVRGDAGGGDRRACTVVDMTRSPSGEADARVEPRIEQVDDELVNTKTATASITSAWVSV